MTGEMLYNMWVTSMSNEGVDCDGWESLSEQEKAAWNDVASDLRMR